MTFPVLTARLSIATAGLGLSALVAVHLFKPDIHPLRTMISQYARGRYGWLMALCFAALAAASVSLVAALVESSTSLLSRIGLAFLLFAAIALGMAARFPMDPVSTPPGQMSFSGRMHGVSFLIGVPCQLLAVLLLSLSLDIRTSYERSILIALASLIWVSIVVTIGIMLKVGPGKPPNPNGPERFLGLPNRLFMGAYAAWLIVAAGPTAR